MKKKQRLAIVLILSIMLNILLPVYVYATNEQDNLQPTVNSDDLTNETISSNQGQEENTEPNNDVKEESTVENQEPTTESKPQVEENTETNNDSPGETTVNKSEQISEDPNVSTNSQEEDDDIRGDDTTTVSGRKIWNDENNEDGKRPSSIVVELYKTIEGKTSKVTERTVRSSSNWRYEFEDLPTLKVEIQ